MSQEAFNLDVEVDVESIESSSRKARSETITRLARYTALKLFALFLTVVAGVYITIIIANMGGHVDEIRRGTIREQTVLALTADQEYRQLPEEERSRILEERIAFAEQRFGLDQPFIIRSFRYLSDALTLNLGFSEFLVSDSGSRLVRNIILERLPSTLILFGTGNLILFFASLSVGLSLSRRYGSFWTNLSLAWHLPHLLQAGFMACF